MGVLRQKQRRKTMKFYNLVFKFRGPYRVQIITRIMFTDMYSINIHKQSGCAGRKLSARVYEIQTESVRDVVEIAARRGKTLHMWFRRE